MNTPNRDSNRGPRRDSREMKPKSEYKDKILDLRRVTRVVAGGKRMSFRATVVIGNEKGQVGIGVGKGLDVAQAVDKGKLKAKKNLITIPLKGRSIPHEVLAKYSAAQVVIKPAKLGHGLKAGGSVRDVLLLAGIKDATSKTLGTTKNKLTNGMATIEALKKLKVVVKTGGIKAEAVKEQPEVPEENQ
ncbi:TPA: 30S ribosomal protein S5 [Candidatus Wolfebacteria bacterium]|nr:30S ribosomal protein S5 [Candidatus Wolfebacteria bacterium]